MKLPTAICLILLSFIASCATTITSVDTHAGDSLSAELFRLQPTAKIIGPVDDKYESFSLIEWKRWLSPTTKIYKKNAWDCDDIALEEMVLTRRYYATFGKTETTPAVGIAFVIIRKGFLGVNGGGSHALNIIHTKENGWMFYEPQTEQSKRVSDALTSHDVQMDSILF